MLQKDKRRFIVFGESVSLLLILGGMMIFTIDQENLIYSDLKIQSIENSQTSSVEQILEPTNS